MRSRCSRRSNVQQRPEPPAPTNLNRRVDRSLQVFQQRQASRKARSLTASTQITRSRQLSYLDADGVMRTQPGRRFPLAPSVRLWFPLAILLLAVALEWQLCSVKP